ncbi:MAG: hypothetical protein M3356_02310 [Actinomycetota bacterium]|nr:hypothetical protein [Actinomycetota bacterium]
MDYVPAVWRIPPGADEDKLADVLGRLAEQLGIDTPEIGADHVFLPAEYPHVAQALDEVEPGWRDESLLLPPEP